MMKHIGILIFWAVYCLGSEYATDCDTDINDLLTFTYPPQPLQDQQHAGKNGVVRAIMNNMASVYLYDDGQEIDVPTRFIEPTAPSKFDKVGG